MEEAYGECPVLVDVGEGFDHVWDGERFGTVPVEHAVGDG